MGPHLSMSSLSRDLISRREVSSFLGWVKHNMLIGTFIPACHASVFAPAFVLQHNYGIALDMYVHLSLRFVYMC